MKKKIDLRSNKIDGGLKDEYDIQSKLFNKRERECLEKNKDLLHNYVYDRGIPIWAARQVVLEKNGIR